MRLFFVANQLSMQKIYLTYLLMLFTVAASAQINKDKILLGGNIGLTSNKTIINGVETDGNSLVISSSIGKFYKANRAAGIYLSYQHAGGSQNAKTNGYASGLFMRQYKSLGKQFYFFSEELLTVGFVRSGTNPFGGYSKTLYVNAAFIPGFSYQATSKMQIELNINNLLTVGYTRNRYRSSSAAPENTATSGYITSNIDPTQLRNLVVGFKFIL
jgi:hypothetical protein